MKINDIYLQLAEYHLWATNKLLDALSFIPDEQYYKDAGMFFRSIHGTVNHLLLTDKIWYSRFTSTEFGFTSLSQELYTDRNELSEKLIEQVSLWKNFIVETEEHSFAGNFSYKDSKGNPQETNIAMTLNHVFNHATHHRGQISTAVSQLGHETPVMDLVYFIRLR